MRHEERLLEELDIMVQGVNGDPESIFRFIFRHKMIIPEEKVSVLVMWAVNKVHHTLDQSIKVNAIVVISGVILFSFNNISSQLAETILGVLDALIEPHNAADVQVCALSAMGTLVCNTMMLSTRADKYVMGDEVLKRIVSKAIELGSSPIDLNVEIVLDVLSMRMIPACAIPADMSGSVLDFLIEKTRSANGYFRKMAAFGLISLAENINIVPVMYLEKVKDCLVGCRDEEVCPDSMTDVDVRARSTLIIRKDALIEKIAKIEDTEEYKVARERVRQATEGRVVEGLRNTTINITGGSVVTGGSDVRVTHSGATVTGSNNQTTVNSNNQTTGADQSTNNSTDIRGNGNVAAVENNGAVVGSSISWIWRAGIGATAMGVVGLAAWRYWQPAPSTSHATIVSGSGHTILSGASSSNSATSHTHSANGLMVDQSTVSSDVAKSDWKEKILTTVMNAAAQRCTIS